MGFEIKVDPDMCMGAQRCTYLAPEVFELQDDGTATVIDASSLTEEKANEFADECPNLAIIVESTD
jgi:ferredoxin